MSVEPIPVNEDAVEKAVVRMHPVRVYGVEVITPGRTKHNVIVAVVNGKVVSLDMPTTRVRNWMEKQILEAIGEKVKDEDDSTTKPEGKETKQPEGAAAQV